MGTHVGVEDDVIQPERGVQSIRLVLLSEPECRLEVELQTVTETLGRARRDVADDLLHEPVLQLSFHPLFAYPVARLAKELPVVELVEHPADPVVRLGRGLELIVTVETPALAVDAVVSKLELSELAIVVVDLEGVRAPVGVAEAARKHEAGTTVPETLCPGAIQDLVAARIDIVVTPTGGHVETRSSRRLLGDQVQGASDGCRCPYRA